MNRRELTRRTFLFGTLAATAGCATMGRRAGRKIAPSEKLNVAGIGVGGQGAGDLRNVVRGTENVVALCDVDWDRASNTFNQYANVPKYKDYREMLDKEAKNIDAVVIATPDHMHAVAAAACIELGKHVYVEKPLTHSIYEANRLLELARRYKVCTQMGNQGHSGEGVRQMCEIVWSGIAGEIREAHIWTNRPVWPQGIHEPLPEEPVPATMDWNLWIGVAPMRPYNKGYAPFAWRGWWDFGCGALGDMGCHIMDPPYWALDLSGPISVECTYQEEKNDQTAPTKSIVRYEFPERVNKYATEALGREVRMAPVTVYWYEGGLLPERPAGVPEGEQLGDGDNGSLFIGEKGVLTTGCYGDKTRLVPESAMKEQQSVIDNIPRVIPRVEGGHHQSWVAACKGGPQSASNFEYAVPMNNTVLLGNLSMRSGMKVEWDAKNSRVTNNVPGVEQYIRREYRSGYSL